ncbi:outer membrane beta-barrel protein [Pseudoalteromonas spongiae]|uniref:outer membrane beta-barrel protein n=1 Tax=Pseudoalteromonas spongiae TaxID=298657 RepID=UPI00110BD189|nr:outer membrane beta-barrel protein [Pseudoalteromonas spongiae]TMO83077.1 porin family protein [Pseudoalteromonas spongiae]
MNIITKLCRMGAIGLMISLPFVAGADEANERLASKSQCQLGNDCMFAHWYLNGAVGYASGDYSASDLTAATAELGFDVYDIDVKDGRMAGKLNLGASLSERVSIELGYTYLGEVSAAFSTQTGSPDQFFALTQTIHPTSVNGVTLSGTYTFWQTEDWYLHARLGLFAWQGDYDALDVFGNRPLLGSPDKNGTDVYFALGGNYQLDTNIHLTLEWERYHVNSTSTDLVLLGLSVYFD